jgi:hypothetical protein
MIRTQRLSRDGGGRKVTGSRVVPVKDTCPTLTDVVIDKKLSARAQKLAAVPAGVPVPVPANHSLGFCELVKCPDLVQHSR